MTKQLCTGYESTLGMPRREFLNKFGMGLGSIALTDLMLRNKALGTSSLLQEGTLNGLHHKPKAKRVIYLFQSGGPSQIDLWDYKPELNRLAGQELPDSVRKGQRLTAMSGNQASLPLAGSPFKFSQHGESGTWVSEALPYTSKYVDDLCVIRSLHTEAINHGPGVTFMQTGSQFPGRPSIGAWLDYGLGSENDNLPSYVVMVTKNKGGQPLVSRLWGNGFLPSKHQGVRFRSGKDPILYLSNPEGISNKARRHMLDGLNELHMEISNKSQNEAISERISQYEMAFKMQSSIPEATDISNEPQHVVDSYGPDARKPGSFAANCLQARRLAERGVRFIQIYHPGWDQHGGVFNGIKGQAKETDQPTAALLNDLKQRGMLEDTLVIWGGEFGRTNYCQGKYSAKNFGRDHHGRCFSMWMAGGGIKPGSVYGSTDDFSYNIQDNPVHVHDFHATLLYLLGIDHENLTHRYQGRYFRLTDVHGNVQKGMLS